MRFRLKHLLRKTLDTIVPVKSELINFALRRWGGGGLAVDRRPHLRCANVLNHPVHVQQTRSSSSFTGIHVVCGTCKVNVVKNAFPKHVQYTGNHPCYYKVSYFEFLKSLVQKSKRRPDIVTVPLSLSKNCLVVCSTSMRHDHKEA
jgi:hypothetical protein